ncbi:DUF6232 family protein [Chitinophaga solisilvae]|uniref:DUF6232 family protein n=1 Tax=Chitinophaga solisilvae TaxID=1233460 RepID=UPI001368B20B|nr:DUF6232 family protein [Chitinophaga solisilvae]
MSVKKEDGNNPYRGSLIFTNTTLSFEGTTIQLKNVTRFTTHEVKRYHRISPLVLLVSIIVFFLSFSWKGTGYITVISGAIAGFGIYEYFRPKLYALIIELSSASNYTFSSVDKEGIFEICRKLTSAMTSETPVNTTVTFNSDKIIFGDHVARDKYEVNNSNIAKMGSFNNNTETPI